MTDVFKVLSDSEAAASQEHFDREFLELTGCMYPPPNQAAWATILSQAGFSQDIILRALNTFGFPGFEECGELPRGMTSVGEPRVRDRPTTFQEFYEEFGWPTFSQQLMDGLRRSMAELDARDPWQGWQQMKEYAGTLKISTKKIQRRLTSLMKNRLAKRESERGKINLRRSACEILTSPE